MDDYILLTGLAMCLPCPVYFAYLYHISRERRKTTRWPKAEPGNCDCPQGSPLCVQHLLDKEDDAVPDVGLDPSTVVEDPTLNAAGWLAAVLTTRTQTALIVSEIAGEELPYFVGESVVETSHQPCVP